MRRIFYAAMAVGFGWALGGTLWAHEGDMPPARPASAEFNFMKKLQGQWTGTKNHMHPDEKPGPVTTSFQVTSGGTAIEEKLMTGTPHEMVDMYVDEGGKLAMTHYCAMGNQPHLVLAKSDAKSVTLVMGQSAGIDAAKDAHMHEITLAMPDANHLTERWTSYKDGKPGESVEFTFTRK